MAQDYRAIRYHEYGGPDKLVLDSVSRPELKEGEVLVKVRFAGVNPVDWKLRSGAYKAFMPVDLPDARHRRLRVSSRKSAPASRDCRRDRPCSACPKAATPNMRSPRRSTSFPSRKA